MLNFLNYYIQQIKNIFTNDSFLKNESTLISTISDFDAHCEKYNINTTTIFDLKVYLINSLPLQKYFVDSIFFKEYVNYYNLTTRIDLELFLNYYYYVNKSANWFYKDSFNETTIFNIFIFDLPFFRVGVSTTMQALVNVHHYIFHFIIAIVFFVTWFIFLTIVQYGVTWSKYFSNRRNGYISSVLDYSVLDFFKFYVYVILSKIDFYMVKYNLTFLKIKIINYVDLIKNFYIINILNKYHKNFPFNLYYCLKNYLLVLDLRANTFLNKRDFFKLKTKYINVFYNYFFADDFYISLSIYRFFIYIFFQLHYLYYFLSIKKNRLVFLTFIFDKELKKKSLFLHKLYVFLFYKSFLKLERIFLKTSIRITQKILSLLEGIIIKKSYIWTFVAAFLVSKTFPIYFMFKQPFYKSYVKKLKKKLYIIFKSLSYIEYTSFKQFLLNFLYWLNIRIELFHFTKFKYLTKKKFILLNRNLAQLVNLIYNDNLKDSIRNFYVIKNLYISDIERREQHSVFLEVIWTIIPSIILCIIAIPSFILLYSMDGSPTFEIPMIIKVVGHQWYWEYQYVNEKNETCKFDSYMLTEGNWSLVNSAKHNLSLRLLDTNAWLKVPTNTTIKFLITSVDVIHSWAVPSFGIKVDAIPGRINQTFCNLKFIGTFYGQCSELCGVNHGFMPIKIQVFAEKEYDVKTSLFLNK